MRVLPFLLAIILAALVPPGVSGQLLSARTQALAPPLAGLLPDEWSDGVLRPAEIPAGGLAFARVEWSGDPAGGRRFAAGGRFGSTSAAVLAAGSRGAGGGLASGGSSQALVAARFGRGDAAGLRYAAYGSGPEGARWSGESLALAVRAAAGRGWIAQFQAEFAELDDPVGARRSYRAGEFLLQQPGPERSRGAPGWDLRRFRLRGGVGGRGAYVSHWMEGSAAHLHAFERGGVHLGVGWGVRLGAFRTETGCPEPCTGPTRERRYALALDGALEARLLGEVAVRGGFSINAAREQARRDDIAPAPQWIATSYLTPGAFGDGAWLGLGWDVRPSLSLDAAVDALGADHDAGRTPVSLQASWRF